MDPRSYGSKYDGKLSTTEIAARVRAEVKAAVKSGELPKGKYSIRTEYYSMGSSITISAIVPGLKVYDVARLLADRDDPHAPATLPWRSAEATVLVDKLEAMLAAYNHDGSDSRIDHYDVKFAAHVAIDGDRDAEMALLPPKATPSTVVLRPALACGLALVKDEDVACAMCGETVPVRNGSPEHDLNRCHRIGVRSRCSAAVWHDPGAGCALCSEGV
jgi:hypothetical protein